MAHHAECGVLCLASSDLEMILGVLVPAVWVAVLAGMASLVLDGGLHMVDRCFRVVGRCTGEEEGRAMEWSCFGRGWKKIGKVN